MKCYLAIKRSRLLIHGWKKSNTKDGKLPSIYVKSTKDRTGMAENWPVVTKGWKGGEEGYKWVPGNFGWVLENYIYDIAGHYMTVYTQ